MILYVHPPRASKYCFITLPSLPRAAECIADPCNCTKPPTLTIHRNTTWARLTPFLVEFRTSLVWYRFTLLSMYMWYRMEQAFQGRQLCTTKNEWTRINTLHDPAVSGERCCLRNHKPWLFKHSPNHDRESHEWLAEPPSPAKFPGQPGGMPTVLPLIHPAAGGWAVVQVWVLSEIDAAHYYLISKGNSYRLWFWALLQTGFNSRRTLATQSLVNYWEKADQYCTLWCISGHQPNG